MKLKFQNLKRLVFVDPPCQHGSSPTIESSSFTIECSIITTSPDSQTNKQTNDILFNLTFIRIGICLIAREYGDFNIENNVVKNVFELECKLECDTLPSSTSGNNKRNSKQSTTIIIVAITATAYNNNSSNNNNKKGQYNTEEINIELDGLQDGAYVKLFLKTGRTIVGFVQLLLIPFLTMIAVALNYVKLIMLAVIHLLCHQQQAALATRTIGSENEFFFFMVV